MSQGSPHSNSAAGTTKQPKTVSIVSIQRSLIRPCSLWGDGAWTRQLEETVIAFETLSSEAVKELVESSPGGKGNSEWHPELGMEKPDGNGATSPLWRLFELSSRLPIFNRLIERVFSMLMHTGCATTEALNMRGCSVPISLLWAALLCALPPTQCNLVRLLLSQVNTKVTFPRCQCIVKHGTQLRCGSIAVPDFFLKLASAPHLARIGRSFPLTRSFTTLGCIVGSRVSSDTWNLLTTRFGADLITEEYAYANFGACYGNHDGTPGFFNTTMAFPFQVYFDRPSSGQVIDDEVCSWMAERLPIKRMNGKLTIRTDKVVSELLYAMSQGLLKTARALLARVPDYDPRNLYTDDSTQPDFPKNIPSELMEEFNEKKKLFSRDYHAHASAAVSAALQRKTFPNELSRLVFEYAELIIPAPPAPCGPARVECTAADAGASAVGVSDISPGGKRKYPNSDNGSKRLRTG